MLYNAISIHALREESDDSSLTDSNFHLLFLSTLSVRRATLGLYTGIPDNSISIHALREESDSVGQMCLNTSLISIHALREESD